MGKNDNSKNKLLIYKYCRKQLKHNQGVGKKLGEKDKNDLTKTRRSKTLLCANNAIRYSIPKKCNQVVLVSLDLSPIRKINNKSNDSEEHLVTTAEKWNVSNNSLEPTPVVQIKRDDSRQDFVLTTPVKRDLRNEFLNSSVEQNPSVFPDIKSDDSREDFVLTSPEKCNLLNEYLNLSVEQKPSALPFGSVNQTKLVISSFKDCTYLEGSFIIEEKYMALIKKVTNHTHSTTRFFLKTE